MKPLIPVTTQSSDGAFYDENKVTGEEGTIVDAAYMNSMQGAVRSVQSEIISILAAAGMQPDQASVNQLMTALDGRFLKALSPALTGVPTAPTPAFGVDTTQISNMAALHAAKFSLTGVNSVTSTNTLTPAAAGSLVYMTGNVTFTTTLPPGNTVALGQTIHLINYSTTSQTIATSGANIIYGGPIFGSLASMSLPPGASINLVSRGNGEYDIFGGSSSTQYVAGLNFASPVLSGTPTAPTAGQGTNTGQLATTAFVNASMASGLLEQTGRLAIPLSINGVIKTIYIMWGRTASSADTGDTVWTVGFPFAFPTAFLSGQVTLRYPSSIEGNAAVYFYNESQSGMNVRLDKYSDALAGFVAHWLVIGY
ncbi:hypothetical protein DZA65_02929 [Dickeya dianthicola]|uniref:Putative tail fiber protein gp53-like C-terminal domain-containing protein n=1 Tax=Dickeya dianthicola TaxID=204039 RepID=A0ABX9NNZ2_9GAMM|nr:hypothetical protein [Dickeya dianthicola]AYC19807.1 hypothetical protein DZA65_02929 [Dickeya dianthicola]MBI0436457.1 hypothetical protein [Dickeya dianthicola]MBI0447359.1 hypothetical protein [Dickeya dianthicola]MBI0451734.1 hypothetical protein [Dickeya dianthicola]MBI0456205.1 hypothetical protein [Dickeya dianthicola]